MFRWAHVRVPVNSTQKLSPDCLQNSSSTATVWHSNKRRFAQLRVHVHLPGSFRSCSVEITKKICISRYGFEFIELTLCYLQIPKKKVYFRACMRRLFIIGNNLKNMPMLTRSLQQATWKKFSTIWRVISGRGSWSSLWVGWSDLHPLEISATATESTGDCHADLL